MKFSSYNRLVYVPAKNSYVVLNTKNQAWAIIDAEPDVLNFKKILETQNFDVNNEVVKVLYDNDYIVDSTKNEFLEAQKEVADYNAELDGMFYALLYVTKQCNFRCIYCPEDHVSENFSDDLWQSLYKHIEKGVFEKKYNNVSIAFFGGEPLLESNKILNFMEKLNKLKDSTKDLSLGFNMTSNAYLLTPKVYDKLSELGLKSIQITVDGFAEIHDKMRPRVDGKGTWDTIIENLDYVNSTENGARITFRSNLNHLNQETIQDFVSWAKKRFNNPKFSFDLNLVVDFSDAVDEALIADESDEVIQKITTSLNKANAENEDEPINNLLSLNSMVCKCSAKHFYAFTPDWKVSKCENIYKGEGVYVGKLLQDGAIEFNDTIDKWLESPEIDSCKTCYIYPQCNGRMCPYRVVNTPEDREHCCELMLNTFNSSILGALEEYFGEKCEFIELM